MIVKLMLKNQIITQSDKIAATIARVLHEEASAIQRFANQPNLCAQAAEMIHGCTGPLIVAGMGKSGHVARKIAATFRSLVKPAIYLHPSEASHGDLGLVQSGSVVLLLSNSGETPELSDLLHYCRLHKIPIISITAKADSTLAKSSSLAICYGKISEACSNGLAPTTSTTLTLAIGDALAVAVAEMQGVVAADFRRYHPGGRLGARLLTVGELMQVGDALPLVTPNARMSDVVVEMSAKSLGLAILADGTEIVGVITDGDLRRNVDRLWQVSPRDIATAKPICVRADWLASEAAELMARHGISVCLVEDEAGKLAGVLHIHDCLRAGAGA